MTPLYILQFEEVVDGVKYPQEEYFLCKSSRRERMQDLTKDPDVKNLQMKESFVDTSDFDMTGLFEED